MRQLLIAGGDPSVLFTFDDQRLLLPLSHYFPKHWVDNKNYGRNIGLIARLIEQQYPSATVIDVGANVGDTVAIIRRETALPTLCIEGDESVFAFLVENTKQLDNVELEMAFLGPDLGFSLSARESGTARLIVGGDGESPGVRMVGVEDMLDNHPGFSRPKLLKVDTDGLDTLILEEFAELLSQNHPVIFFEYCPELAPEGVDMLDVFPRLWTLGYRRAIFFRNSGEYLLTVDLQDAATIRDLSDGIQHAALGYFDICVLAEDDVFLASQIRDEMIP